MPVYIINGKKHRTDAELSPEDLEELGGSPAKKDTFAKGPSGFELGTREQANKDSEDWWHLPVGVAAGGAAVAGAKSLIGAGAASKLTNKEGPVAPPERVEPVFQETVPETPVQTSPLGQLEERAAQLRKAVAPPETKLPETKTTPSVVYKQPTGVPSVGTQMPTNMPAIPGAVAPTAPTVTEAVMAGESPSKAVQATIAEQIDQVAPEAPKAAVEPPSEGVKTRVRRTKEQIAAQQAAAQAAAPEGMLPSAPKKTNKMPGDVIGQGGWHWYEGQMGPEAKEAWMREFGRTNQPYSRVVEAVKSGRLPVPAPTEGKKGGTFPRQEYVPDYIKGGATPAQLFNVAGNALGVLGNVQALKEGMRTGDYSDAGLGVFGQILSNVAPRAGLAAGLMTPGVAGESKAQLDELGRKLEYANKVGFGRGVAPPEDYIPKKRKPVVMR